MLAGILLHIIKLKTLTKVITIWWLQLITNESRMNITYF